MKKNIESLPEAIKALAYTLSFYWITKSFGFYPSSVTVFLSIAIFFFAFAMPEIAIGIFLFSSALSVYALKAELLPLFIISAVALSRFFVERRGLFFILFVLALVGSFVSIEVSALLLAVYFLGMNSAILGAFAVLFIEIIGILLGKPVQGLLVSAGTKNLIPSGLGIEFKDIFNTASHITHIKTAGYQIYVALVDSFIANPVLFIQPVVWVGIAVIGSKIIKRTYKDVGITYLVMTSIVIISQLVLSGVAGQSIGFFKLILGGAMSFAVSMALTYPSLPFGREIFGKRAPEAVLVIDIVGSTAFGEKYGDELSMKIKNRLKKIVDEVIPKFDFRFIKGTGDGYFITFPDSTKAVNAALQVHNKNNDENKKVKEEEKVVLKMGMSFGEVVVEKNDRFGSTVNTAFRIQGVGESNMVDVSGAEITLPTKDCLFAGESVIHDIDKENFDVKFLGYFEAKGLFGRHKLYNIS